VLDSANIQKESIIPIPLLLTVADWTTLLFLLMMSMLL
jgi:hypothetical protein